MSDDDAAIARALERPDIRASALFRAVDASALAKLVSQLVLVELPAHQRLFRQADPGDSAYVLLSGSLQIVVEQADGSGQMIDELQPGATVGELALLTGQPRSASVIATEASTLVRLSRAAFEQLADQNPEAMLKFTEAMLPRLQRARLVEPLTSLFGTLEPTAFRQIEADLSWIHLHNGETLFRQGDPGDSLYIVIIGRLQLFVEGVGTPPIFLEEVSRGESIGEQALLTGQSRSVTAYAARDTYLVQLSRSAFEHLVDHYPRLALGLSRKIVTRLPYNRAHQSQTDNSVATIAVLPAGDGPHSSVARDLATALGAFRPTLYLNASVVDEMIGKRGVAYTADNHPTDISLVHWLSQQEANYSYIVYESDPYWSSWTSRCIQQADRILIVGQPGLDPRPGPIEQQLEQLDVRGRQELVLLHAVSTPRAVGTDAWLNPRQVFTHHHVRHNVQADIERLARRLTGRAVGLVCGGGGARGFAHIGVIKALEEAGIAIDLIGGSSMGALIGASYAMGFGITELEQRAAEVSTTRKLTDYTLPLVSVFAGKAITRFYRELFGDTLIEDLWMPFFCMSSSLTYARPVMHTRGLLWRRIRGSTSLPMGFPPLLDDGELLVDGGLMNNLPVAEMRSLSEGGPVIAVDVALSPDLTKPYQYEPGLSGWRMLWSRINPRSQRIAAPSLLDALLRSLDVNFVYHTQTYGHAADLFLAPPLAAYGTLQFRGYQEIIEIGYQTARSAIQHWREK